MPIKLWVTLIAIICILIGCGQRSMTSTSNEKSVGDFVLRIATETDANNQTIVKSELIYKETNPLKSRMEFHLSLFL